MKFNEILGVLNGLSLREIFTLLSAISLIVGLAKKLLKLAVVAGVVFLLLALARSGAIPFLF